jgi:hypothetical protein
MNREITCEYTLVMSHLHDGISDELTHGESMERGERRTVDARGEIAGEESGFGYAWHQKAILASCVKWADIWGDKARFVQRATRPK